MLMIKKAVVAAALALFLLGGIGAAVVVKSNSAATPAQATAPQKAGETRAMRPVVQGTVVDAAGKAVAGAQVYLADPDHPAEKASPRSD